MGLAAQCELIRRSIATLACGFNRKIHLTRTEHVSGDFATMFLN